MVQEETYHSMLGVVEFALQDNPKFHHWYRSSTLMATENRQWLVRCNDGACQIIKIAKHQSIKAIERSSIGQFYL